MAAAADPSQPASMAVPSSVSLDITWLSSLCAVSLTAGCCGESQRGGVLGGSREGRFARPQCLLQPHCAHFFFKIYFYNQVCVCECECKHSWSPERTSQSLELELQVVVSCLSWVLGSSFLEKQRTFLTPEHLQLISLALLSGLTSGHI